MKKIHLIILSFLFFSCEKNIDTDPQNNEFLIEVSVFLSESCPIAQYMTLPLKNSYNQFASDSVIFTAYFPNLLSTQESIYNFKQKYSIPFSCLDDNTGEMVSLLGATVYSEVFIIFNGEVVYKGMIDDSYTSLGQWSPAENHYLYDILEQLIGGGGVDFYETIPVGCLI
tara:strand:- start:118 stop:627 length:510 start_codon:yes stop_codon:yes gene_type:complete